MRSGLTGTNQHAVGETHVSIGLAVDMDMKGRFLDVKIPDIWSHAAGGSTGIGGVDSRFETQPGLTGHIPQGFGQLTVRLPPPQLPHRPQPK